MEKETLIQELKTKVGEDNAKVISDRTFDGIAESVLAMFADDEKITEETWKLPLAALNQFAGQKRYDEKVFTEKYKTEYAQQYAIQHEKDVEERIRKATEDAIEKYKKEHPEQKPDKKPEQEKDLEAKIAEFVSKAMGGLMGEDGALGKLTKQFSDYVAAQSEREKSAIKNRVKSELKKHLLEMKANNEACVDDALDDIEYGETPSFDALKQNAIDAYEKRYKRYYADGGKPFGGSSVGGRSSEDGSYVKARLTQLQKEAEDNAAYAKTMEQGFM